VDKSDFPMKIYNILNLFLWFDAKISGNDLEIFAIDKEGLEVELTLSKEKGTYKIDNFYLTIKKASEETRKEIENEVRDNN
jgi:hypothetical protein